MDTTTDRPGPFAGIGTTSEIETDLGQAFDKLIPIRDVHDPEILKALAKHLPRHVAIENQAVLLECNQDGNYVVGMSDPLNAVNVRNVVRALRIPSSKVRPRLVIAQRLTMLQEIAYEDRGDELARTDADLDRLYDSTRETIDWHSLDSHAGTATLAADLTQPDVEIGLGTGLRATAEKIILAAIKRRASDIHVIPGNGAGRISIRTDGIVSTLIPKIPAARMENLANAFSDMAGVNGYELMQRSKGAEINITVRTNAGTRERMTLRFHGTRSYYGRAIIIRINRSVFRNFDQIGIETSQQRTLQRALDHRHGVILVTGATGSGKSNTLEAMLRKLEHVHQFRKHIIQIGNPIEFPNERRTQLPIDADDAWGKALKDAMRMDPDFFSPFEIRAADEAAIVFQGAATGHLTLTTLHTNNVAQTFSRLDFLNIGRDKQADLIRLVVSQELVPLLCRNCRKPDPRGREIAERLVEIVFPNRPDLKEAIAFAQGTTPFFHAEGCPACHNVGLKGRTCIAEMLEITPEISRMLRQGTEGEEIVDYAIRTQGMMTLAEAAARKLCRGMISFDSVQHLLMSTHRAAPEKETHAWQTNYDNGPARNANPSSTDTNSESETVFGDVIDVEFTVPPQARAESTQHAAAAGFSMMELLIVVAIIAILAAIAIPSFIASRRAGYENTAKQKLAAIGQQQTAFKTLIGKRRYGSIAELQAANAGGSALLTTSDTIVTGWTFSDEGAASATTFGAKVLPGPGNPANYSFYISEDQTLRRCALTGPWTKAACTPVDQ
ncbi:MAG TPA: ATPase, T2SS/T4P/T4SS family [Pyrinomonadaceae bacterium]|nr:ATPase, T2SS/T4P/T4SS family [Pyrinomonadaceae bacterium]